MQLNSFWQLVLRHNQENPTQFVFKKKFENNYFKIRFEMRSKNNLMGRFGGGWNWKLGVQIGGSTIIISLLVAELIISRKRNDTK